VQSRGQWLALRTAEEQCVAHAFSLHSLHSSLMAVIRDLKSKYKPGTLAPTVVPAAHEAEARGPLKSWSSRPAWQHSKTHYKKK
jgi:hypothetical protein